MLININFHKLDENAVMPAYAKEGDAAMDCVAISKKSEKEYIEYGTGLALEIPKGHVCLIFPRSSISNKKLSLSNSVGVLDSGYRGELKFRFYKHGEHEYDIGDKVGQIIILPYPQIQLVEVEKLSESQRGANGFGSTGK
jgi:dUTP pyrophosphatase